MQSVSLHLGRRVVQGVRISLDVPLDKFSEYIAPTRITIQLAHCLFVIDHTVELVKRLVLNLEARVPILAL